MFAVMAVSIGAVASRGVAACISRGPGGLALSGFDDPKACELKVFAFCSCSVQGLVDNIWSDGARMDARLSADALREAVGNLFGQSRGSSCLGL
jgi:hypothetical protein